MQYSLLDRRPLQCGLVSLCKEHNIKILAYGVLAGGFLTDAWLGAKAPTLEVYSFLPLHSFRSFHQMELWVSGLFARALLPQSLSNRSLVKYLLIIQEFGGWQLYQELLQALRRVADRHSPVIAPSGSHVCASVAMVAIQYILSQNQVGGVIIGASDTKWDVAYVCWSSIPTLCILMVVYLWFMQACPVNCRLQWTKAHCARHQWDWVCSGEGYRSKWIRLWAWEGGQQSTWKNNEVQTEPNKPGISSGGTLPQVVYQVISPSRMV